MNDATQAEDSAQDVFIKIWKALPSYQEEQLSPDERQAVEEHLAGCAGCRAFAEHLEKLDAALSRAIKPSVLSEDFNQRLRTRIQEESSGLLTESQQAELRRKLEAELATALAELSYGPVRIWVVLAWIGYSALVTLAGWMSWQYLPAILAGLAGPSDTGKKWLVWAVLGAFFTLVGMAAALRERILSRWLQVR